MDRECQSLPEHCLSSSVQWLGHHQSLWANRPHAGTMVSAAGNGEQSLEIIGDDMHRKKRLHRTRKLFFSALGPWPGESLFAIRRTMIVLGHPHKSHQSRRRLRFLRS